MQRDIKKEERERGKERRERDREREREREGGREIEREGGGGDVKPTSQVYFVCNFLKMFSLGFSVHEVFVLFSPQAWTFLY